MPDGRTVLDDLPNAAASPGSAVLAGSSRRPPSGLRDSSGERRYAAGEALMNQGDVGDELIVIVEGTVDVVQQDGNGSRRFIRSYGAGDYIGELAVLRQGIRVATVLAHERGKRPRPQRRSGAGDFARTTRRRHGPAGNAGRTDQHAMTDVETLPTGTITFLRSDVEGPCAWSRSSIPARRGQCPASGTGSFRLCRVRRSLGPHRGRRLLRGLSRCSRAVRAAVAIQKSLAAHA